MATPRLISLVVCTRVLLEPKIVLYGVRRRWATPPESFELFADIENPTEQPFTWRVQIFRGSRLIAETPETLELHIENPFKLHAEFGLADAETKTYSLRLLLNERLAGKIPLDMGDSGAQK